MEYYLWSGVADLGSWVGLAKKENTREEGLSQVYKIIHRFIYAKLIHSTHVIKSILIIARIVYLPSAFDGRISTL